MPLSSVVIGAQSRLGIGIEGVFAQPVKASRRMEFASSDLVSEVPPVYADSLFNAASEFRKVVPGAVQVAGDISLNITPEGAWPKLLCAAFGPPTSTLIGNPPPPSAPVVVPIGATGATTYTYYITAVNAAGESLASITTTITNGNAVLDTVNYNRITWEPVTNAGVTMYMVYGRVPGLMGALIALDAGTLTYDDQGELGAVVEPPVGGDLPARWEHIWKNTFDFSTVTLVEQKGPYYFVTPGCRVGRLAITTRKTQDRPLFVTANVWGVHQIRYDTEATVGLDTATMDPLDHWPAVIGRMSKDGSAWAGVQDVDITIDKQLERVDVLDGYRGMGHFSRGSQIRVEATLYFSTDAEYKEYFGRSAVNAVPYGLGMLARTSQLDLLFDGVNNIYGYSNTLRFRLYRCMIVALSQPLAGRDAVLQRVALTPMLDDTQGTDFTVRLINGESNEAITAAGVAIPSVPANYGTGYTI